MKKISPTITTLVILTLATICIGVLYAYLLSSLFKNKASEEAVTGTSRSAESILKEEKVNREILARYFVAEGSEAAFVSSVESFCRTIPLSCAIVSLRETPDPSGASKMLSMEVAAEGSLADVNRLLAYFESAPYPIVVGHASLTLEKGVWKAIFDLTVPVLISTPQ